MLLIKQRTCMMNLVKYEKNDEFRNIDFNKDRLDAFLTKYLTSDNYKSLWHICNLIFVLPLDQSNVKRFFCKQRGPPR